MNYNFHKIRKQIMAKPEEKELKYKKSILSELKDALSNRELELATLRAELLSFQNIYLESVGELIAELDELEAQIAEGIAKKSKKTDTAAQSATRKRARATESARAFREESERSLPKQKFAPTDNLKQLFREVAKKIHPDLASDEKDREIREDLMKRANEAYQNGDEEKLHSILEEYEERPESIEGNSIGAELIRVIRDIDSIDKRINAIANEIDGMTKSELFFLKKKLDDAKMENRDFLGDMADYLRLKIQRAKIELEEITN
jgi:hypothetical protein